MAVKLELYRVFKEVAETGNISLAAKNLYISQSAVSQSVKQLETALQARLFARSPRGVSLTGEGQMLYQYVRSALGLLATGEDKLSQAQQLLLGTLVIGASDTVTSFFLTPYLDAFHRQHPGIRLKIVSGRSAKVLSMLRSGAVDIAFASSPSDSNLESWSCFSTHSVFVAGSGYPCDFDHVYTRREIADFPLILLERKASSRVFLEQEFLRSGVTLTPEIELSSRQLLVAPRCLQNRVLELIDREADFARRGQRAYIGVKINSLTDKAIIDRLIEASRAGVQIDLIVRGICCLLPGIPGLTDHIRVISIVGRFLEHSRIYLFGPEERQTAYLASADFMTRNTLRRVEVAAPILDGDLRRRVNEMFQTMLRDNQQARELRPTGEYVRLHAQEDALNAQEYFYRQAYERAAEQPEPQQAAPAPRRRPRSFGEWFRAKAGIS